MMKTELEIKSAIEDLDKGIKKLTNGLEIFVAEKNRLMWVLEDED